MTEKEFLNYIEDKTIQINDDWFFHATDRNINTIEQILNEGIISAYLRKEKSKQGYNGKYYVSVSKKTDNPQSVYNLFEHLPLLVLSDINPIKADNKNKVFKLFTETFLPFRTSSKADEYHAFLKIEPTNIIALGYSLYHMMSDGYKFDICKFKFLKELILILEKLDKDLPIYDLSSNREINKNKVKSLELGDYTKLI